MLERSRIKSTMRAKKDRGNYWGLGVENEGDKITNQTRRKMDLGEVTHQSKVFRSGRAKGGNRAYNGGGAQKHTTNARKHSGARGYVKLVSQGNHQKKSRRWGKPKWPL